MASDGTLPAVLPAAIYPMSKQLSPSTCPQGLPHAGHHGRNQRLTPALRDSTLARSGSVPQSTPRLTAED